jgi:hypothetical protein
MASDDEKWYVVTFHLAIAEGMHDKFLRRLNKDIPSFTLAADSHELIARSDGRYRSGR